MSSAAASSEDASVEDFGAYLTAALRLMRVSVLHSAWGQGLLGGAEPHCTRVRVAIPLTASFATLTVHRARLGRANVATAVAGAPEHPPH